MREILIAGNWKMNGSRETNEALVAGIVAGVPEGPGFRLLVCPPFPYLAGVVAQAAGSAVSVGAQNVSEHVSGAFTGEVAPGMLRDIGCDFVIVGHSERRALYGESSFAGGRKISGGPGRGHCADPVCRRDAGRARGRFDRERCRLSVGRSARCCRHRVICQRSCCVRARLGYWYRQDGVAGAGTGGACKHIRALLAEKDTGIAERVQILYGGSMKGENAAGLLSMPDIDGGLIGGASLKANDFLAIANAAAQFSKEF